MDQSAQFLHNSNMRSGTEKQTIKSYNLFGETGDMPDMVHCESIAARSKLHNWEFAPHRHARLHQVLVVEKGSGRAILEAETHALGATTFVNVPVGCVHAFSFREGTQGFVVTLAAEALDETVREGEGLRPALARPYVGRSSAEINRIMRNIAREHETMNFGRAHILRALSGHLAGLVARRIESEGQQRMEGGETALQRRFEALVEERYSQHWSVAHYARELAVAAGHLSRVMRQTTGMPASRFIEARLVREARRLLAFTNLPVSEIAYELGFADPAYFTRVFSRATGVSPRGFRDRLETRR